MAIARQYYLLLVVLLWAPAQCETDTRTYLRRMMDDTVSKLLTESIASGTGSDAGTAAKALVSTTGKSTSTTTKSTSTSPASAPSSSEGSSADDTDDVDTTSTSTSTSTSNAAASDGGSKAKAAGSGPVSSPSPPATKTVDWYDDDATADAGDSTSNAHVARTNTTRSGNNATVLPNGRMHRDKNNPHADKKGQDHTSTNDDDDVGYIFRNTTSNEDFVLDDDTPKTGVEEVISIMTKRSSKMRTTTKEGYVAAFAIVAIGIGVCVYALNRHCGRMIKKRQAGYQPIE
mmetsp:Transcript_34054/g.68622  ORF Transcript_34054/g.68622 Transcript_34054/m.68622 type:complete len:288 (-) Transcript_34054:132-995(-)